MAVMFYLCVKSDNNVSVVITLVMQLFQQASIDQYQTDRQTDIFILTKNMQK